MPATNPLRVPKPQAAALGPDVPQTPGEALPGHPAPEENDRPGNADAARFQLPSATRARALVQQAAAAGHLQDFGDVLLQ